MQTRTTIGELISTMLESANSDKTVADVQSYKMDGEPPTEIIVTFNDGTEMLLRIKRNLQ